jgi:CMP-N-acetylneuraminic acid synthetase
MKKIKEKKMSAWCVNQAISILSVDNIQVSDFAKDLLDRRAKGEITAEQVRAAILDRFHSSKNQLSLGASLTAEDVILIKATRPTD